MTFYTRGLALDSRHPRFIPLRIADRRPRLVVTCTTSLSPVVKYHGLARRHVMPPRFLMRPLLNGGTLGGPHVALACSHRTLAYHVGVRRTGEEHFWLRP